MHLFFTNYKALVESICSIASLYYSQEAVRLASTERYPACQMEKLC